MTLTLSENLDRYFTAQNTHDIDEMVACFEPNARVQDEGRDYAGRDEIRRWKEETVAKYGVRVAPLHQIEGDGMTTVVARVAGNFPGSPAELNYEFTLAPDGLIRTLAIH